MREKKLGISNEFIGKKSKFRSPIGMNKILQPIAIQRAKMNDELIKLYCIETNLNPSEINVIQKLEEDRSTYYLQNKNKNLDKYKFTMNSNKNNITMKIEKCKA